MSEDELREIEKRRKERELAFAEFKGGMNALHLMKLNDAQETFFKVIGALITGLKSCSDGLDNHWERQIHSTQRIKNLEEQVQLIRTTLDTFEENR